MANPSTQRELRYNVTLVGDTKQAEQAFQRVAQNVDQVTKKAQEAQRAMAMGASGQSGYGPGGYHPTPAHAPAGESDPAKAAEKPKADALGTAATLAKIAFWTQAVGNVTDALGKLGDEATGTREKVLGLVGSVPIIGDAVASIAKAGFDLIERVKTDIAGGLGTYDAKRRRLAKLPFDAAREAAEFARHTKGDDLAASDRALMDRAATGVLAVNAQNVYRFGSPGLKGTEKEFDAVRRAAQSQRIAAMEARDVAGLQYGDTRERAWTAKGRYQTATRKSDFRMGVAADAAENAGVTDELDLKHKLGEAEKALAETARERTRYEQLATKQKQEYLSLLQSEQALRKANIGLAQAELQIVGQKLAKAESSAEQFGNMDPLQQQAVLRAAQRSKEYGYGQLSPEQKQLLSGTVATADYARTLAKQSGEGPVLSEIQKLVGDQDAKTIKAEQQRLQAKVNLDFAVDASKLEEEVKKSLSGPLGKALAEAFDSALRLQKQEIELKWLGQKVSKK